MAKRNPGRRPKRNNAKPARAPASRAKRPEATLTRPKHVQRPENPLGQALGPANSSVPEEALTAQARTPTFPIVGLGASAGGLEALEQFLRNVPEKSGVAFVVVQHLDPTHKGMFVELLQRSTSMPVFQAKDEQNVEPDHVYVIPPNKDMSILHGTLHLLPQASPRGLNLPIDFFFRSLAEDQQERGIGVILSGMGSDGTLGLRAIKEKAGAAFVQALTSAKFDSMPRSAIEAGLADVVAPVDELPGKILAYRQHAPHISNRAVPFEDRVQGSLEKVYVLLRAHTGNDFSLYKRSTIYRRIERRMGLHQIDSIGHYVRFLRENPREIDLLFKELLIGVTSFFRDPGAWEHLKKEVMPALISMRATGGVLRAWVPGCSTGEEAYSLAIVFREAMEPFRPVKNITLQVFATDLDRDAIEKARQGLYPDNIAADVSPERLRRFFVQEDRGYRVGKEIREMVVFAPQNIIMDPPFTKLDILSCRNLLIYLSAELQKKLIPLFHYSLNPGGVLFLGSAETVGSFTSLFGPLDGRTRLYRRLEQSLVAVPVEFPSTAVPPPPNTPGHADDHGGPKAPVLNVQALADRVLVQKFSPVGILCNDKGDILYISGRAGKYLEPAVGKANLNVFAMARDGLRYELSSAFSLALREQRTVTATGVKVGTNGGTQTVDLSINKLVEPKELRGTIMIVISDVAPPPREAKPSKARSRIRAEVPRIAELQLEIERAREEVQTTREEMQTSQEELKSTNEELQSTNEELQSTNEELTTSKEEMQSLNEELQTVNHELQAKVDELSRSNNDMKNLLNSTDIATLFLDSDLNVRRFTTPTARIIKLIPGDAGRPITDIASDLDYPDLADDAREVLRTLVFKEKQVSTHDGRWFTVRIMPYRTLENVIDGVVITFMDASSARALEVGLREQASQLRQIAESLPTLVWGARPDGSCDYLSRQWVEYTGVVENEQLGFGWLDQIHPDDRERTREGWRTAVKAGTQLDLEFRIRSQDGGYRWFKTRSVPIRDVQGTILRWYGTSTDIEDVRRGLERRQSQERLAPLLDHLEQAFLAMDPDLTVTFLNAAAEQALERDRRDLLGRPLLEAVPDLRGSPLDQQSRNALREKTARSFDTYLTAARQTPYHVRVHPVADPEGVVVLLERDRVPTSGNPGS
jgi:two-component system CheB/CheR fusion protein